MFSNKMVETLCHLFYLRQASLCTDDVAFLFIGLLITTYLATTRSLKVARCKMLCRSTLWHKHAAVAWQTHCKTHSITHASVGRQPYLQPFQKNQSCQTVAAGLYSTYKTLVCAHHLFHKEHLLIDSVWQDHDFFTSGIIDTKCTQTSSCFKPHHSKKIVCIWIRRIVLCVFVLLA